MNVPIVEAGPLEGRAIAARSGLIGLMRWIHSACSVLVFERTGREKVSDKRCSSLGITS